MGYKVFLIDTINYVELDTEDLDMTTTFSVADINDIVVRKDNVTKEVTFKGTKVNNNAFGSLFHLNRTTNSAFTNKLFFNYNPLRTVDTLVMEDNIVLFKGTMRVLEVDILKNGDIQYQTVITGKFTEFKNIIQDKLLSDLDFSGLKHSYTLSNLTTSWTATKGTGYVYPHIDYGHLFNEVAANQDKSKFNVLNYRPAVYVKEYLNKIFTQPELNGFSYEVKGSQDFLDKFNSLFVPDSQQKNTFTLSGFNTKLSKNPATTINQNSYVQSGSFRGKMLPLSVFTPPVGSPINNYLYYYGAAPAYNDVFFIYRTVTTDAIINVNFSSIVNPDTSHPRTIWIEFVERDEINDDNPHNSWQVIGQVKLDLAPSQSFTNKNIAMPIGERTYLERKQIGIRVLTQRGDVFNTYVQYNITSAELSMPKDASTQFKADIKIDSGDTITPVAPDSIKQVDFLKSLVNLFNIYVYTETTNPKHVIFECYDDFYNLASPSIIKNTAINWTNKIDYTGGLKFKSNLQIPKSYLFTFKDDSDYINADYKKKYNDVYGSFSFSDSLGVTETKKIELIFSATPVIQEAGSLKMFPVLYAVENDQKKLQKSNIRILFYNGLQNSESYNITKDINVNKSWTTTDIYTSSTYPQASSYYLVNGLPVDEIHFGRPKESYFPATANYVNANTSYTNYYTGQITELTNPNLAVIECDAVLNELDISNLDLKTPIFIDLGEFGHSYFKVISVEYISNKHTSKVVLQKIVLGTDR